MFKIWWKYEWAVIRRAALETKWTAFCGWGLFLGILAYLGQMKAGLHTPHDTLLFLFILFGCAAIGASIGFLIKLFTVPSKMATEQQERLDSTTAANSAKIQSLQTENARLSQQLADDSPNVTASATMTEELGNRRGSFAKLTVFVKNLGKITIRVENVILINPFKFVPENEVALPFETDAIAIDVPPNGGLIPISFTFRKRPEFMPQNETGEEKGNGYIQLTVGEKIPFTFTHLRDIKWAVIKAFNDDLNA